MMTMHINVMMPQHRQPNLWPRGSLPRPHVFTTRPCGSRPRRVVVSLTLMLRDRDATGIPEIQNSDRILGIRYNPESGEKNESGIHI